MDMSQREILERCVLVSGDGEHVKPSPISQEAKAKLSTISICPGKRVLFVIYQRVASSLVIGMHLADASLFLTVAMTLAAFDITKTIENGQVIEPVIEYTSGTIR